MRSVLVTGVSSGIGRALAELWLARDCRVLGISRRRPERLVEQAAFYFESVDLADHASIGPAVDRLLSQPDGGVSRLDLVVLNAGILGPFGDLADTTLPELQHVLDVNLWANKCLIDALFRPPRTARQVVTISSGASVNGHRGWNAYAISKAALNMLTRLYAAERPDCHFTALAPGIVDTAMQEQLCGQAPDARYPSLERLRAKRHTPDMPTPDEAAATLADAIDQLPARVASGELADIRAM